MIKLLFVNLSVLLVTLLLCLGGLELVAQAWEWNLAQGSTGWELVATRRLQVEPTDNIHINYKLEANRDYLWEGIPVHINSDGLRDIERSFTKLEGVRRVLCLGDSVIFGWEVASEDTYAKHLEALLQAREGGTYEVINAGIPGWDLATASAYLEESGLKYDPDLIIVGITVDNDIGEPTNTIRPPSLTKWLHDHTALWPFLSNIRRQLKVEPRAAVTALATNSAGSASYPFPLDEDDPVWDSQIRSPLLKMAETAKRHDIGFMIAVFPADLQVRLADYPATAQQVIAELGREHDTVILDLLPLFRETYAESSASTEPDSANPLFADYYSHLSPLGHHRAAEALYRVLMEQHLLKATP